ncbi:MAG: FxsA family protein, partial [Betaproteobacteria bacterium]|nr:FxsA family protein [Betaproteobacteria bacterium]
MRLNVGLGFAIIVLAFPILESVGIYQVWQAIGVWTLVWLALAILLGWGLMLHVQKGWALQILGALQSGTSPWHALTAVGLRFFAGLLFVIPGPVSDAIGGVLLLASFVFPAPASRSRASGSGMGGDRAMDPGVIDGEWRRVDDPALAHDFTPNREPPDSVK